VLQLQASAGNRVATLAATGRGCAAAMPLQRQPAPASTTTQPSFDLEGVVKTARARSRNFEILWDFVGSPAGGNYTYEYGEPGRGSYTQDTTMYLDPTLSEKAALIQVMYEVGNAYYAADFAQLSANEKAGKIKSAEEYAKRKLMIETQTATAAALSAIEAGETYWPEIDAVVRKHAAYSAKKQRWDWKSPQHGAKADTEAFPIIYQKAVATDPNGNRRPARDVYADQWRGWHQVHHP
jgi:hypothetical protein